MRRFFALLCGILLLCAACAPVTPETPEHSADATTAVTTATTEVTTATTTASTIEASTTLTTEITTVEGSTATTPTAPSTTAKTTTSPGYISAYPVPFTVDEYRAFLAEAAKNPEHITDTIAKDGFYKPEYFREWFVDKQAHVPLLSGEWSVTDWNRREDHEVVIEQRGSCYIAVTNGNHRVYLLHYMYDSEETSVDRWLSTYFKDVAYEITQRRALTTKDGREALYIEVESKGSVKEALFINVDGYCWRISDDYGSYEYSVNIEVAEDLLANLSFEKIEL